jgi:hypothetical protein
MVQVMVVKTLLDLAAAVPDSPTTGTYGGINRANLDFLA